MVIFKISLTYFLVGIESTVIFRAMGFP